MRLELIENWKQGWRLWSVCWAAAIALLPELLYQLAVALGEILPALSAVVVTNLPPWLRATLATLGVIGVAARLVRQHLPPPGGVEAYKAGGTD